MVSRRAEPRQADPARVARYRREGYWRNETLVNVARRRVAEAPDKPIVVEGASSLTREEVWIKALRLARFVRSRGLLPGDVISFQLPNWSETLIIALAARMTGTVLHPVPPMFRESELEFMLNDCGARLLFAPVNFRNHDYHAMITPMRTALPRLADVVYVRGEAPGALSFEQALAGPPMSPVDLPTFAASSVMMVMYTSGTTGRPKGVLHTHQSYGYKVRQMSEFWKVDSDDVVFMPSPVTHISGAFWSFDMPWVSGGSTVLLDVWRPEQALQSIETHRCTISGGATPFLQQLIEAAAREPVKLRSLRTFFCGGTTVSSELITRASRLLPECLFFRAYGSTEMPTAAMGIRCRDDARHGAETDGEVVYPVELRIVDDAGSEVADGEEGEILLRGPELFAGYLHDADNEGSFDEQGYFKTGDLGRRVDERYLVITGRKKDIIIRSGENISPKEVEDLLLEHPAVAEVAIVSMPSPATGEMGCAFVIPRPAATLGLPEVQRFLSERRLARQKFPEYLVLVEELPRVASGKVRKDLLRHRAAELAAARNEAG